MLFTLAQTATGQSGCADPTPGDSAWWRLTLLLRNADGSVSMTAPKPPAQAKSFSVHRLRGPMRAYSSKSLPRRIHSLSGAGLMEASAPPKVRQQFILKGGYASVVPD